MSRWVVPKTTGLKAAEGEPADGPTARVAKYVPAEVVSVFTLLVAGCAAMKLPDQQPRQVAAFLIVLFFLATIGYIWNRTPRGAVRIAHLIVSPLSFLAWAYPISSMLLGDWFVAVISFLAQAVVLALSLAIQPRES